MPSRLDGSDALPEVADRLRHGVLRLARILRQQDDSGLGATAIAALVSVKNRGALTLGELAACEQVAPPTMTKVVEKLETHGFVERETNPDDRRVSLVSITPAGRAHLAHTRQRRTAWIAERLEHLGTEQYASIVAVLDALEALVEVGAAPEAKSR